MSVINGHIRKFIIIIGFFIFFPCVLQGQDDLRTWHYELIEPSFSSSISQLKNNIILGSTIDEQGLIWLSTLYGIATFDGDRFRLHPEFQKEEIKYYTQNAWYLKFDSFQRLWILTHDRGLLMYDFATKTAIFFNTSSSANHFLSTNLMGDLYVESKDLVWIATTDFIIHKINLLDHTEYRYDVGSVIRAIYPDAQASQVGQILTKDDHIWLATQYGIVKFDKINGKSTFIKYEKEPALFQPFVYHIAMYLHEAELVVSPIFKDYMGISVLDTKSNEWIYHSELPQPVSPLADIYSSFSKWSENEIIGGRKRMGFRIINLEDYGVEQVDEVDLGFEFRTMQEVKGVYRIHDRLAYFVCANHIVKAYPQTKDFPIFELTSRIPNSEKPNWQRCFMDYPKLDGILIGSHVGDGLLLVNMGKKRVEAFRYKSRPGALNFDVTIESMVEVADDQIFLGTSEGLLVFNVNTKKITKYDKPGLRSLQTENTYILELFYFDHILFLSTRYDGLFRYDISKDELEQIKFNRAYPTLSGQYINDMLQINDSTYYLSGTFGLRVLIKRNKLLDNPGQDYDHPVFTSRLGYMLQSQDSIWIGSQGHGLFKVTLNKGKIGKVENYKNRENQLYNETSKIIPDKDGIHFWLNTDGGFSKFNHRKKSFTNYSLDEGIGFRGRASKVFYQSNNDMIIAGDMRRFEYFFPDSLPKSSIPVIPYIGSFQVNDMIQGIRPFGGDSFYLSREVKAFGFDLGAINPNVNTLQYFSYKLDGYDDNWSNPSMSPIVRYTRVPGGTYQFKYKAANRNFNWTDGQFVQITVKKKLIEYPLFWIGIFVLISGFLWYTYNQRMRTLKKQAKIEQKFNEKINELEANALRLQMNPHFIFNAINSINWFIIKNDQENASNYLAKISRLIRLSLENSKSKLIPLKNELEAITIYLQMERLRFEKQFDFEIDVVENLNPSALYIPPMIIQPFVENAIWHGLMNKKGKGKISLTIKKLGDNLRCIVEDDGIGRKAAHSINKKKIIKKKSMALDIIEERLHIIEKAFGLEAKTDIIDLYDADGKALGTRVVLDIPQIDKEDIYLHQNGF